MAYGAEENLSFNDQIRQQMEGQQQAYQAIGASSAVPPTDEYYNKSIVQCLDDRIAYLEEHLALIRKVKEDTSQELLKLPRWALRKIMDLL